MQDMLSLVANSPESVASAGKNVVDLIKQPTTCSALPLYALYIPVLITRCMTVSHQVMLEKSNSLHTIIQPIPPGVNICTLFTTLTIAAITDTEAPTLRQVLRHHGLWMQLLPWHAHNRKIVAQFPEGARLTVLLDSVSRVGINVLEQLKSEHINLRETKIALQNEDPLYELSAALHAAKKFSLAKNDLKARMTTAAKTVQALDDKLQRFQCFLNTFCTCGISFSVGNLRASVDQLSREYDRIKLVEAPRCLDSDDKLLGRYTKWLYSLRTSELFLQLWRQSGSECLAARMPVHKRPPWLKRDTNPFSPRGPVHPGGLPPGVDGEGASLNMDRLVKELFPLVERRWKVRTVLTYSIVQFSFVVFFFCFVIVVLVHVWFPSLSVLRSRINGLRHAD